MNGVMGDTILSVDLQATYCDAQSDFTSVTTHAILHKRGAT
jgi:hypothetical protein